MEVYKSYLSKLEEFKLKNNNLNANFAKQMTFSKVFHVCIVDYKENHSLLKWRNFMRITPQLPEPRLILIKSNESFLRIFVIQFAGFILRVNRIIMRCNSIQRWPIWVTAHALCWGCCACQARVHLFRGFLSALPPSRQPVQHWQVSRCAAMLRCLLKCFHEMYQNAFAFDFLLG